MRIATVTQLHSPGIAGNVDGGVAVEMYVRQRVALGHYAPTTARATRYLLRSWLRFAPNWEDPTADDLITWVTVPRSRDGKHRREAVLRRFYRWAFEHGWVAVQVGPRVPTIRGSDKRPKPIPDHVLAEALARACEQDRDAILLGRFAGLRAAEIAGAHRDHLGPDGLLYVLGKGDRERWVEVHPRVRLVLMSSPGYVFPSQNPQTMSKRLGKALPAPWTAHTLRHAFASDLYARTRDLVVVAEQLGHASTVTTERYVLVKDERARAAIWAMNLEGDSWGQQAA